ncbi:MAG: EpsI family protein [Deltaproteobacteria bacterium]|nr:MAG: EpsI family protein [Deltaproteobacteria bacterium]
MVYKRAFIIIIIIGFSFLLLKFAEKSEIVRPNQNFDLFPEKIGVWSGKKEYFDNRVYDVLGVDDSVFINYKNTENKFIQLYIGFYQSQKKGDLIHSPKNCMPGAGWNIVESVIEKVRIESLGKDIKVIKLILKKGRAEEVMLYWFHSRGRIISSEYMQKIWLVIDSITKGRTDGSFVRFIAPVYDGKEKEATALLKSFINQVYPYLKEYIPS